MTKRELGAKILKELNVLPNYVKAFEKNGTVMRSEAPYGFAYFVNNEEKAVIVEMAERGEEVYAVIMGNFIFGGEKIKMTAYLYVKDRDIKSYEWNLEHGATALSCIAVDREDEYGYNVAARVIGFEDEYGLICVRGRNGGLVRTA